MKNALNMIFYYFTVLILGTVVATLIYMICYDLTVLVAGEKLKVFCWDFFLHGLVVTFPLVASFALGFLIFYGIRHNENHFARLAMYAFLCALSWGVFIPLCFNLQETYESSFAENYEIQKLSSGYFRQNNGNIFYFSRITDNGEADGVFIDLLGVTGESGKVIRFTNSRVADDFSSDFADSLVKDAIKLPLVVLVPMRVYSTIMENARNAWSGGVGQWLCFLTFALALCSVVSFQYSSGWRLINGLCVMFAAGLVCLVNYGFYCGMIFKNTRNVWNSYFMELAEKNTGFLKNLFCAQEPMLVFINLVVFAVILITGILLFAFKYKKRQVVEQ